MNWVCRCAVTAAALWLCVSAQVQAQDGVSLLGMNATLNGSGVQVELHTSAPAEFTIDRFALGDYIFLWAPGFEGAPGKDEIPLEFDQPELSDIVSGASLANEGRRHGIRVYLGSRAERRGAFVVSDGDKVMLFIPAAEAALPAAEELQAPLPAASAQDDSDTLSSLLGSYDDSPDADSDTAEAASDSAGTSGTGSFYIPRQLETAADAEQSDSQTEESFTEPTTLTNVFDAASVSRTEAGELNYQIAAPQGETLSPKMPPQSGSAEPAGQAQAQPAAAEEPAAATTPAETAPSKYSGVPRGKKARQPLSTGASGEFYNPYLSEAALGGEGAVAQLSQSPQGKEQLRGIMIELFEIVNTPLDQALTLLVAPTDFNIIVDASVGANLVSLAFKESRTDLKSALDLLTRTYGLDYIVQANTIVVASKDKVAKDLAAQETRLFILSYADPQRVKALLEGTHIVSAEQIVIYGGEGFSEGGGGGGGGGPAGAGGAAMAMAGMLGEEEGGGGGGGESGGGIQGVSGFQAGEAARAINTNLSSTPPNSVLVQGTAEQLAKVEEIIRTIDRRPKIIELEVRVCEATETALHDLGLTAQDPTGDHKSQLLGGQAVTETWSESSPDNKFEAFTLGSMLRSGINLSLRLNTLQQDGKIETLAQPVLTTVEDRQANYFAGERIPYVSSVSVGNGVVTQNIKFLDVGVTLAFKPRLDADGSLTIQVEPVISSLLEFVAMGNGVTAPRTQSRNVQAMVRVQDNEPFVLAGLITTREKETMNKIPFLADLPMVGKLFRNKSKDNQRTEVIIVVTPHIRH